jgi:hypothetical protein
MSMLGRLRNFGCREEGGAAVEFVAAMIFFVAIVFFSFEIAVAVFWNATAEKAAQIGARLAIVSDPAVTSQGCPGTPNPATNGDWPGSDGDPVPAGNLPLRNCRNGAANAIYGTSCSVANTCHSWGPVVCVGDGMVGSCDDDGFAAIAERVRSIFNLATDQRITIRYEDTGLGFAGGPAIPLVTVEIANVPYDLVMTTVMDNFWRVLCWGDPACLGTPRAFTLMPTVSATLTGEDLSVDS